LITFIPDFRAELMEYAVNADVMFIRWLAKGTGPTGPFEAPGADRLIVVDGFVDAVPALVEDRELQVGVGDLLRLPEDALEAFHGLLGPEDHAVALPGQVQEIRTLAAEFHQAIQWFRPQQSPPVIRRCFSQSYRWSVISRGLVASRGRAGADVRRLLWVRR